jgi:hypothetical protein
MRKTTGGMWVVTLQLAPGRYQYKFVVDGTWVIDADNPDRISDNYGGQNSVVAVGK